ncbi:MAG: hypothetical protein GC185_02650 [Alphaproteobacteria bacterium]|nr:hypothetical protein [Alphaproteobacteria bacterium]
MPRRKGHEGPPRKDTNENTKTGACAMFRDEFNENSHVYSDERHAEFLRRIEDKNGPCGYRLGELPILLSRKLMERMVEGGREIIMQGMDPALLPALDEYVPEKCRVSNAPDHPSFILVDYALIRDDNGDLAPRLIEFQGVGAHLAWLADAAETYKEVYSLGDAFKYALSAQDRPGYDEQIRKAIVGNHDPKNVVLMEIDPWNQGTRMDFVATQNLLGIKVLDVTDAIKRGDKLYYLDDDGREVRIERIYSRMAMDEFDSRDIADKAGFRLNDELDVEWAGEPVWQHRMSKAVLPYIDHPLALKARLLSDGAAPDDLENYVLKPLFGRGGAGVVIDVTPEDLAKIPREERGEWLLMEKVEYAQCIQTPDPAVTAGAEVRILFTWDDEGLKPAIMMGRVTGGKIANLSYNNDKFLGLSPVLYVEPEAQKDGVKNGKPPKPGSTPVLG